MTNVDTLTEQIAGWVSANSPISRCAGIARLTAPVSEQSAPVWSARFAPFSGKRENVCPDGKENGLLFFLQSGGETAETLFGNTQRRRAEVDMWVWLNGDRVTMKNGSAAEYFAWLAIMGARQCRQNLSASVVSVQSTESPARFGWDGKGLRFNEEPHSLFSVRLALTYFCTMGCEAPEIEQRGAKC